MPEGPAGVPQRLSDRGPRRRREDQHCEILEGHLSTSLAQLSTISYRVGRKIVFDPDTETIKGDPEASKLLTPKYRAPYVVPDKV